jgi:TolA-binding protein
MRKLRILACLFFSFTLVFPTFPADLDHAKTLFEEKQYESALAEFKQVFESSTGDTRLVALLHILRCDYFLKNHSELASYYNTYISEAENTSFEPDIHFQYANSLMDHAKDYSSARSVYEMLYQEFPNTEFAGSGSLLKLGDLDVLENKAGDALSRYSELETNYPNSPYIDNALLGKVKAYAALKDRASLLAALQDIKTRFPDNTCTAIAGIEAGIYFAVVERNRDQAVRMFEDVIKDYPNTKQGVLAKIRLADLNPHNDIDISIKLYHEALQEKAKIPGSMQAWCECELGFSCLIKGDNTSARTQFENVLANGDYPLKYHEKAQRFLNALNEPEGTVAYEVSFDLAFRHRDYLNELDRAENYYRKMVTLWNKGIFNNQMNDPGISNAQKAKWLYQLAIAQYFTTNLAACREITERIKRDYPDEGEVTAHAEFLGIYMDSTVENRDKREIAIEKYMNFLEKYPDVSFAPRVFRELGMSLYLTDRIQESLISFDALIYLYPYHLESQKAGDFISLLFKTNNNLQEQYETIACKYNINQPNQIADIKNKDLLRNKLYRMINKVCLVQQDKLPQINAFEEVLVSMNF